MYTPDKFVLPFRLKSQCIKSQFYLFCELGGMDKFEGLLKGAESIANSIGGTSGSGQVIWFPIGLGTVSSVYVNNKGYKWR